MRRIGGRLAPLVAVLLALHGCGGGGREDPLLRLSAEEAFEQGTALLEAKKYAAAREYLNHAFQVEPNSATGREALLLAADAYFLDGGEQNFVQAEAKYRDFQNRFPTTQRADYVQFQIARSLQERMLRPDRDQTNTLKTLQAYEDLVSLYPTSEYVEEARTQIAVVRRSLAEHEFGVGRWSLRRGLPMAAVNRFKTLLEEYPEYPEIDRVLFNLGKAYLKLKQPEEAKAAFERLREEHPGSDWIGKIPEKGLG